MKSLTLLIATLLMFNVSASINVKKQYNELKYKTSKKIKVLDKKLDKMKVKISKMSGEAKDKMQEQYKEALTLKDKLKNQVESGAEITADKWDNFKDRVKDYTDSLESKIDESIKS